MIFSHTEINFGGKDQIYFLVDEQKKRGGICWCYGLGVYCRSVMENGTSGIRSIIIDIICQGQQATTKCPISFGEIVSFTLYV